MGDLYPPGPMVLVPFQLTSPSGVAGPRGTPCDVPENVRLGRPWGPRLAMLVSWPGTIPHQVRPEIVEEVLVGV